MIKAMLKNRRGYMRRQGYFDLDDSHVSNDLMDIDDDTGMDVDGHGDGYEGDNDGGDEENPDAMVGTEEGINDN
jgi:hypothetical protein